MFEAVVILALAPFAAATVVMGFLLLAALLAWAIQNIGNVLIWSAMLGLTLAALILQFNPELAATLFDNLVR